MSGQLIITTPTDRDIAMTREFDAPAALVFDAYTKPELLKRWLGVWNGWTLETCEVDLRVGGAYRYLWRGPGGKSMGMGGTFREIVRPERIVATETFDDPWYEGQCLDIATFTEKNGKTTLTITARYDTKQIRDAVLASPMETGVTASFDNLAELLVTAR